MKILLRHFCEGWEKLIEQLEKVEGLEVFLEKEKDADDCDLIFKLKNGSKEIQIPRGFEKFINLLRAQALEGENLQLLQAIINSVQDAISVVDEKGRGLLINPAYTRITGLTEDDVIGHPATVDIAEGESMHYKVLKTGEPVSGVPLKVGPQKKDVIVNVSPIIINGNIRGSVGVIHDISDLKKLSEELDRANRMLRRLRAKYTFEDIIGSGPRMQEVVEKAKKASQTPVTVLLRGESGTGKEFFAHAIHNESERSQKQFIRVNCPAIPDSLIESELFGYEEGAFTGASAGGKRGLFEEANYGTIFLDEVAKMGFQMQAKLLRVLQEKEFTRVGGTEPVEVDVRTIVATNADLEEEVRKGNFREDLYYRLNVFPIYLPPLRERKEDLSELVDHLIKRFNQEYGRMVKEYEPEVLDLLADYDWPGNVRELENVIGRAMIEVDYNSEVLKTRHFPPLGIAHRLSETSTGDDELLLEEKNSSLKDLLEAKEREVIRRTLAQNEGNRKKTAEKLGVSERNLYYKMKKHQLA